MDSVEADRKRICAIVEEMHRKKPKEIIPQKVWVKEEIDTSDIEVKPKTKPNEPKLNENTLF